MSEFKCPICGEKIEHIEDGWCNCKNRCLGSGSISLWQVLIDSTKEHDLCHDALVERTKELERTRKALDVAKDAIDVISLKYNKDTPSIFLIKYAQNAKAEITALEQKEAK